MFCGMINILSMEMMHMHEYDTPKHETRTIGTVRLRAVEPDDLPLLKQWRNQFKHFYREYRFINDPHQENWYKGTVGDSRNIYYAIDVWDCKWWLVGQCAWSNIDWVYRHVELGIYIGEDDWRGKGVGLKAMIELHRIAFHEFGMATVRLEVLSFNPAVKFYEKFGYKEVGRYRQADLFQGEYHDSILMDMTKDEWHDRYSKTQLEVSK